MFLESWVLRSTITSFFTLTIVPSLKGKISRGDTIYNLNNGKKLKVPRLVRMHAAEMEVCVVLCKSIKGRVHCTLVINP